MYLHSVLINCHISDRLPCFCSTYRCSGKELPRRTFFHHQQKDREAFQHAEAAKPKEPTYPTFKYWPTEDVSLYEGSKDTVMEVLSTHIAAFTDNNGLSKTALSRSIADYEKTLPQPNNFPSNYHQAKALICKYLTPTITFDSCVNDCILFR